MKKKLALLMAAIMTVAMVPMTAFAATKLTVATDVSTAVGDDHPFTSVVELKNDNSTVGEDDGFSFTVKLDNGKFAKDDGIKVDGVEKDDEYVMNDDDYRNGKAENGYGAIYDKIADIEVRNDTTAVVTLKYDVFDAGETVVLPIRAYAVDAGDVKATLKSNNVIQFNVTGVIAVAYEGDVTIESDGVTTFVEDSRDDVKKMKPITITGLYSGAISGTNTITLKLKGNFEFNIKKNGGDYSLWNPETNSVIGLDTVVSFLNDDAKIKWTGGSVSEDEIVLTFDASLPLNTDQIAEMYISGIYVTPTSKCDPGDVAKLTISSKDFDSVTLEVAKMVEEAVTYTVEDDDLPVIWAGKDYAESDEDNNTLELSVEENTGDILNTSRKATFTFPEGIEVVALDYTAKEFEDAFKYKIDENVVTIWDYSDGEEESEDATDFGVNFLINAAPTFEGDVTVTLGGEFDDVELTVATVKAPYTVEAKTSEVLIDYRYVPVNEIVITEAEEGILEEDDTVILEVEKMDFEDAGSYEVTSGDIDVDVDIYGDDKAYLVVTVKDESTEASSITISGLELYLDRTLPVGGYALENIGSWGAHHTTGEPLFNKDRANQANNILWENSSTDKDLYSYDAVEGERDAKATNYKAIFEYDAVVANDSYVEVVTAGRDQDDSSTTRKIVITIGATTMAVGTETVTLDTPAYINAENYTELPLRAVSEAFGATVGWDDASRTVTIMMGQRIVSMTIGSKTMYINGTPVAMNTAPEITNERTFVPVRDLANALGITKIDWNEASATVTLN